MSMLSMNIFSRSFDLQVPHIPKGIDNTNASCPLAWWSWKTVTNPYQSHGAANVTNTH